MINKNTAMNKLLNGRQKQSSESLCEFANTIVSKTRMLGEAIIYDDEGIDETKVDFSRIFSFVGDWTGYEISCNEIWIDDNLFSADDCVILIKCVKKALEDFYQGFRFVVFVTMAEKQAMLRFHTFRKKEQPWLIQDLESYPDPIAVV